jgi:hypothetical protein
MGTTETSWHNKIMHIIFSYEKSIGHIDMLGN